MQKLDLKEKNNKKFKSLLVSVNLMLPLVSNEMSKNALLALVLKKSSMKYINEKKLERKLSELYNAKINIDVQKYSDIYNIQFSLKVINKKYIGEDVLKEGINIIKEILNNPYSKDGCFLKETVELEKNNLIQKIQEEKDDHRHYAIKRIQEILFEDIPYGYPEFGKLEDIKQINEQELYKHYKDVLKKTTPLIFVAGNKEGYDGIEDSLYKELFNIEKKNIIKEDKISNADKFQKESTETIENIEANQSVLTMGIKLINTKTEDVFSNMVLNTFLGGTPASRLFQNIREKESLAYFAKSIYDINKSAIYVLSGIAPTNYKKTKQLIIKELEDLKEGNITKKEIKTAKDYLIATYQEIEDSKSGIIQQKILNELVFNKELSIKEIINEIKKVNREDVLRVSKNINLQKIFLLGGSKNE